MKTELIALEKQVQLLKFTVDPANANLPYDILMRLAAKVALTYGETYYWSPAICDLIGGAARKLTLPWTLVREMIPSTSGFFWFDKSPSSFMSLASDKVLNGMRFELKLQAISWTLVKYKPDGAAYISEHGKGSLDEADGICIQFWTQHPLPDRRGEIIPNGFCTWRFGKTSVDVVRMELDRLGLEADSPKALLEAGVLDNNVICTAFQFIKQEILVASHRESPDRATAKRLEREEEQLESSWVKVVKLRRAKSAHGDNDKEHTEHEVAWACQWMVAGHWRMQPYPSLGIVQPKWISPYVKGPEDKPMRITETLISVSR